MSQESSSSPQPTRSPNSRGASTPKLKMTSTGLQYHTDRYNSVHLRVDKNLEENSEKFVARVVLALKEFEEMKVKGVWVKIPIERSEIVGLLASRAGFEYHHAQQGYAMLTKWLPQDRPNNLPVYNTHVVGTGGIVIDEATNEVLLIEEMSVFGKKIWKHPGGQVDSGEFIHEAVIREVKEETGIDAEFLGVVACREVKDYRFGAVDIYVVCLLKAISREIKKCDNEISDCKWVSIGDYLNNKEGKYGMTYPFIKTIIEKIKLALDNSCDTHAAGSTDRNKSAT